MSISATQVKELRDRTGAGMMTAKRALEETEGDIDAAQRLLREQGIAAAGKKAGRETTEGIVLSTVSGSEGVLVAIGCETEPVSKNEEFLSFAERVLGCRVRRPGRGLRGRGAAARADRPDRRERRDPRGLPPRRRGRRAARRIRPPAGEQGRGARPRARRRPDARAPDRDAHLVRCAALSHRGRGSAG